MTTVLKGGVRTVSETLTEEFERKGYTVYWLILRPIYKDERDYPKKECFILTFR